MILYEHPFNERVRTYLRLEHLFQRFGELLPRETALDHHFALLTLFELAEVAARSDLRPDVLKDLERKKNQMLALRGNPAIAETVLEQTLSHIEAIAQSFAQQGGKPGHELSDSEWLSGIRNRANIPGGVCQFDLPSYHAWQHSAPQRRRDELQSWAASFETLAQAVSLLLQILRDSGTPRMTQAQAGQFQMNLPQARPVQLLRLRMDTPPDVVPEISGNRLRVSIRLLQRQDDGKLQPIPVDAPLELALCS